MPTQMIDATNAPYQLKFNRLLGRVMLTAVGETLKQQRKIAEDLPIEIQENSGCFELQFEIAD